MALNNQLWLMCHKTKPSKAVFDELVTGSSDNLINLHYQLINATDYKTAEV